MCDKLRQRLIAQVVSLPAEKLPSVEAFLANLECGDSSPLSLGETSLARAGHLRTAPIMLAKSGDQSPPTKGTKGGDQSSHSKDWPHAPMHRLSEYGIYIVTGGTLHKEHWFRTPEHRDMLESALLRVMKEFGWRLEAWAVFSNHYHFVAHAEPSFRSLTAALKQLHGETSRNVNRADHAPGRHVWHNFWETQLTFEKSYLARLNYVHQNAVRHGLANLACQYRWCSAAWFERTATNAQVRTIYGFKIDKLNVRDDYEPM